MQKSEAIAWFGSQNKLAQFLGVAQSNVSGWKNIPKHHQKLIEAHTNGALTTEDRATHKQRYMCVLELMYIDMLKKHAESVGVPVVEILRRAIRMYDKKNSQKD